MQTQKALIYLHSIDDLKKEIISAAPEMSSFFDKLESNVTVFPKRGLPDICLFASGRLIPCYKQNIEIYLLLGRNSCCRKQLSFSYLYKENTVYILQFFFTH